MTTLYFWLVLFVLFNGKMQMLWKCTTNYLACHTFSVIISHPYNICSFLAFRLCKQIHSIFLTKCRKLCEAGESEWKCALCQHIISKLWMFKITQKGISMQNTLISMAQQDYSLSRMNAFKKKHRWRQNMLYFCSASKCFQ